MRAEGDESARSRTGTERLSLGWVGRDGVLEKAKTVQGPGGLCPLCSPLNLGGVVLGSVSVGGIEMRVWSEEGA